MKEFKHPLCRNCGAVVSLEEYQNHRGDTVFRAYCGNVNCSLSPTTDTYPDEDAAIEAWDKWDVLVPKHGRYDRSIDGNDRTVPFDAEAVCDKCGKLGAFDVIGDNYCAECLATKTAGE